MANVHDVAAYIISRSGNMSTMKLQKLCYYSQGWHLAWEGKPLFGADIEAWRLGPVVRSLYSHHRRRVSVDVWPQGDGSKLNPVERSVIDDVLLTYGGMSGLQLSELTHQERPWLKARGKARPSDSSSEVIPVSDIKEHFVEIAAQENGNDELLNWL
ncbi:putative phage-associated protein [Arthrobacter sp. PL16]|uniref:Panacea domain-containing protein n=1 Tax=Arthrobacter sp. PL16 TaxID=3071720 RepID=UPI002DFDC502|nr:putative phage-associated protein [Arthrobacter sp. PL16]